MPFNFRRQRTRDDGFAATFARHPSRPRRGLLPGGRVWATLLSVAVLGGVCAVGVPMAASIDLGGGGPRTEPVAGRDPAAPAPAVSRPTPTPTPTKTRRKKPKAVVTKTVRPSGGTRAPRTRPAREKSRLPVGPKFSTVTHVMLRNVMTGLCADVPGTGKGKADGPVQVDECNGTARDNQRWDLVVNQKGTGPGGADLFTIRNSKDGLCMDLPGYDPVASTTKVTEWRCDPGSGDNQMWYLDRKAKGRFWIRNDSSNGLCLDVAGVEGAGGPGAALTVYPCSITGDHLWSFS